MTLIKFEPLREFENIQNKFQKLLNDVPSFTTDFGFSFNPKIDISEDEKNIYIEAEIPGVKKEDINLTLQDNILTIKGEKKEEKNEEKIYFRNERRFGSFSRSFTLPMEVNTNSCEANFQDGILNIIIQKALPHPKNERQIEIK
jgi:HSP20 family protein